jgi:hypothetical protein
MTNETQNEQIFGNNTNNCQPPINQCSQPNNIIGFDQSVFNFNQLNSALSNATESYVIDDFSVFNLYRHNNLNITRQP